MEPDYYAEKYPFLSLAVIWNQIIMHTSIPFSISCCYMEPDYYAYKYITETAYLLNITETAV
jgi:hypothetical protein